MISLYWLFVLLKKAGQQNRVGLLLLFALVFLIASCAGPPHSTESPDLQSESDDSESFVADQHSPCGPWPDEATERSLGEFSSKTICWSADYSLPAPDFPIFEKTTELLLDDPAEAVEFSKDSGLLLVGGLGSTVNLWNIKHRQIVREFPHPNGVILSVDQSRDGKRMITGSWDHTAKIWSVNNESMLHSLQHNDVVSDVVFHPGGNRVLTVSNNHGILWDANTGEKIHSYAHKGQVIASDISDDGTRIVTGTTNGNVTIWKTSDTSPLTRIRQEKIIRDVELSPGGDSILIGSKRGEAGLWEAESGNHLKSFQHSGKINVVKFSPSGKRVLTAGSNHETRLWDVSSSKLLKPFSKNRPVNAVDFNEDGSLLALGGNRAVSLWGIPPENRGIHLVKGLVTKQLREDSDYQDLQSDTEKKTYHRRVVHKQFLGVFGEPQLTDVQFEPGKSLITVRVSANRQWGETLPGRYGIRPTSNLSPAGMKTLVNELSGTTPDIVFVITSHGLKWHSARVRIHGQTYELYPTAGTNPIIFPDFSLTHPTRKADKPNRDSADTKNSVQITPSLSFERKLRG